MKNVFTLFCLLFLSLSAQATILTLNNNNPTPGQHTTFAAAHDAAAPGDTILVHGSPVSYGNVTISKKLAVIGPGHKPNTPSGLGATFGTFNISSLTGVRIQGVKFDATLTGSNLLTNVDSLIVENCFIAGNFNIGNGCDHVVIRNSVFQGGIIRGDNSSFDDLVVENNFFVLPNPLFDWGGTGNKIVRNNIFAQLTGTNLVAGSIRNTLFENNIFYGVNPNSGTQTDCIYANNITFGTSNNQLPPNGQGGSDNQEGVDPLFVNPTPLASLTFFDYNRDYRLQPGSPAIGTGTNGTDIGVYEPDFIFSKTGEPARPQATAVMPNPVAVPSGGTTNVNFTIRKSTTETN